MSNRYWMVALLAGCFGGGSKQQEPPVTDGGDPGDGRTEVVRMPVTVNRNVDLLFVVDDSSNMLDKQLDFAANLPNLIATLNLVPGGLPDIHIGVVSTDMGTKAVDDASPAAGIGNVGAGGCGGTGKGGGMTVNGTDVTGSFIRDVKQPDGTRQRNYSGDLSSALGQMVRLGDNGCGFEQPLHAMRAALNNHPQNAGFRRPDASLAVLVLTDEDDCSAKSAAFFGPESGDLGVVDSFRCFRHGVDCDGDELEAGGKANCKPRSDSPYLEDIARYRDFLLGLQADPRRVIFDVLGGAPYPVQVGPGMNGNPALLSSCLDRAAAPPVRLDALAAGLNGARGNLCEVDVSDEAAGFALQVIEAVGYPCADRALRDVDPNTVGDQYDCIVYDETPNGQRTNISACGDTPSGLCWRFIQDAASCPFAGPDNLKLEITREAAPPPDSWTYARCKVE